METTVFIDTRTKEFKGMLLADWLANADIASRNHQHKAFLPFFTMFNGSVEMNCVYCENIIDN